MTKAKQTTATEPQASTVPEGAMKTEQFEQATANVVTPVEPAPAEPAQEVKAKSVPEVRSAGVKAPAMPDNSPEALARNKIVTDSRAFLRGQGVADHLYSDDTAVSNYTRFKKWEKKGDANVEFKLNLPEQKSHFDKNEGVVTRGEYSTSSKDSKPYYKDAKEADTPTPAVLKNEGEVTE